MGYRFCSLCSSCGSFVNSREAMHGSPNCGASRRCSSRWAASEDPETSRRSPRWRYLDALLRLGWSVRLIVLSIPVVIAFVVALWVGAAATYYLALRHERLGARSPIEERDLRGRYMRRPWLWLADVLPLWRQQTCVYTMTQQVPEVEAARLRFRNRQRIGLVIYALCIAVFLWVAACHTS